MSTLARQDRPPPLSAQERARLIKAAFDATRLYPGAVGEVLCTELLVWEQFGFRLAPSGLVWRLVAAVEAEQARRRELAGVNPQTRPERRSAELAGSGASPEPRSAVSGELRGAGGAHAMTYTAGIAGFGRAQSTEPRWECRCGGWRYRAQAMPRRKTGNNKIEAERSFAAHVKAAP